LTDFGSFAVFLEEDALLEARPGKNSVLSRNFIADAVEKAFPAVVNIAVDSGECGSRCFCWLWPSY